MFISVRILGKVYTSKEYLTVLYIYTTFLYGTRNNIKTYTRITFPIKTCINIFILKNNNYNTEFNNVYNMVISLRVTYLLLPVYLTCLYNTFPL